MTSTCYPFEGVRYAAARHLRDCVISGCPGCQPCAERHCQVCGREDVTVDGRGSDQTCASCLGETRDFLMGIWQQSARMLGEAIRRGIVTAQAAVLAGPTANPETWGYRRMSVLAGRVDPGWLTEQGKNLSDDDDPHPLWVLATYDHQVRVHLRQLADPGYRPTLTEARDYLAQHLTRLAHDEDFDFAQMHDDLERCHEHLARVLAEDEHVDTGAPCPVCGRAELVKDYGEAPDDDVMWHCPRCDNWWTDPDYRFKILGVYVGVATHLCASQIEQQYRVSASTVRSWAKRGKIRSTGRDSAGRRLFAVAEVLALRDATTEAPTQAGEPTRRDLAASETG